jgi:CheY-like chemotaxis protein
MVERFRPHVVLVDLLMPAFHQCELARALHELQADPETSRIPVLATAGIDTPQVDTQARSMGFETWILKFDRTLLLNSVLDALAPS